MYDAEPIEFDDISKITTNMVKQINEEICLRHFKVILNGMH